MKCLELPSDNIIRMMNQTASQCDLEFDRVIHLANDIHAGNAPHRMRQKDLNEIVAMPTPFDPSGHSIEENTLYAKEIVDAIGFELVEGNLQPSLPHFAKMTRHLKKGGFLIRVLKSLPDHMSFAPFHFPKNEYGHPQMAIWIYGESFEELASKAINFNHRLKSALTSPSGQKITFKMAA